MEQKAALALLQSFIGLWKTTGIVAAGGTEPDVEINGTDSYEWLPGGFFVLHKVNVLMGGERNESVEIIGYDEQEQVFTMHAFDDKGVETKMKAEYIEGRWMFSNDQLRFEGGFTDQGRVLSGNWQQKDGEGNWQQFIHIHLSKTNNSD